MEQRPIRFGPWLIALVILGGLVASKYFQPGGPRTGAAPKPTDAPTSVMFGSPPPSTPAPTPNPDQASGMLSRFYRDLDLGTGNGYADAIQIVTPGFRQSHQKDWDADYGFISEPKLQITNVSGRALQYTLDFVETSKNQEDLHWERAGRWTLAHGSSGWMLDSDLWTSDHLVAIYSPQTKQLIPITDTAYPDGRHEFTIDGSRYSYLAKGESWAISLVASPTPAPDVEGYPERESSSGTGSADALPPPAGQYSQQYVPPPAASDDCEDVDVEGVYDDGKIVALNDGRHLRVQDYDTPTSSVWVAPFDGMICGDRFIDKDDSEGVDLEP